jgi:F-type H+-transporting ATPase subunit delta
MIQNEIAKKYSQALFSLAKEEDNLVKYREEINEVWDLIKKTDDLKNSLFHPRIMPEDKKSIINKLFAKGLSGNVFNFLNLLVDKRRMFYIESIIKEFNQLVNNDENILEVGVTSAIEIDDSLKKKLQGKLEKQLDYEIIFQHRVDPEIIGGIIIRIGDKIIDGSIQYELNSLRERLKQIPVSKLGVE